MKTALIRLITIFICINVLFSITTLANFNPTFDRDHLTTLNICKNSTNNIISNFLAVTDNDIGQTISWSITRLPTHGSILGLSDTVSSTGASISPHLVKYTPTSSFTGSDTIKVTVNDGEATDTITLIFFIRQLPNVKSVRSNIKVCASTDTILSAIGAQYYTWEPATGLSATTGSSVTCSLISGITYTITGTDSLGCQNIGYDTVRVNPLPNVISSPSTLTICSGSDTTFTATGAISYTWSPVIGLSSTTGSSILATPISPEISSISYEVTGTDSLGCRNTSIINVNINPTPEEITVDGGTRVTCIGHTISLSSPTLGGDWSIGSSSIGSLLPTGELCTVTGHDTGVTNVYYSLLTGCKTSIPIHVQEVSSHLGTYYTCMGEEISVIDTYTNSTWGTYSGVAVATVGSIHASFSYSGGCLIDYDVDVVPKPRGITGPQYLCLGKSDTLRNSVSGGKWWIRDTSIAYIDSNTGYIVSRHVGVTTVSYTLPHGCDTFRRFEVKPIPIVNVTNRIICIGNSTSLLATGANSYTWILSPSLSSSTGSSVIASPTVTTIYTVTGVDVYGCINNNTATVTVNSYPSAPIAANDTFYCRGSSSLPLSAIGESLKWYTSLTGGSGVSTLVPPTSIVGTFNYYVSQTVGTCESVRDSIKITILQLPSISINADSNSICIGRASHLTAGGSSINYVWAPAATLSSNTAISVTATPTISTTYTLTGTDSNNCTSSVSKIINVNSLPVISTTPASPQVCLGGTLSVTASGATSYIWSPSENLSSTTGASVIMSPTTPTIYTITGTNSNGCINSISVPVTINSSTLRPTVISPVSYCRFATTAQLSATGTSLKWYTTATGGTGTSIAPTPTSSISGNYKYYVTQSYSGCESLRDSILVIINELPIINIIPPLDTICNGDTTTLIASGALNYSWTPTSSLLDTNIATVRVKPSVSRLYTVIGRDINNCKDTALASIHVNPLPTINVTNSSNSICIGSSVSISVTGALTYSWQSSTSAAILSGSSIIESPLSTTIYTITGTDINSCRKIIYDTIFIDTIPNTPIILNREIEYCQYAPPSLSASNVSGTNILWYSTLSGVGTTTPPIINTSIPGRYTYYVTQRPRLCTSEKDSFVVIIHPNPTLNLVSSVSSICIGDTSTITASGCSTYNWSPSSGLNIFGATALAHPTSNRTYTVVGIDTNMCRDTASILITVHNLPSINITPSSTTICNGNSTTLTASGAISYNWIPSANLSSTTGNNVIASPPVNTVYTVSGTNLNGCTNKTTVSISVNSIPLPPTTTSPISYCQYSAASSLNAIGTTLKWYSSPTSTGTSTPFIPSTLTVDTQKYYVTQTIAGCESLFDSIIVHIKPLPTIVCTPSTQNVCIGDSAHISASGGISYKWKPNYYLSDTVGENISCAPISSKTYTVTSIGSNGCSNTAFSQVIVNSLPVVNISASRDTVCTGGTTTLTASGAVSYLWTSSSSISSTSGITINSSPTVFTIYTVTGTDANGCSQSRSKPIYVNTYPTAPIINHTLEYCKHTIASPLTALGDNLLWYSSSSGGTGNSISPIPNTEIVDTVTYYVTQTIGGCESNRDSISVIILPLPEIGTLKSSDTICKNDSVILSATGGISYAWIPITGLSANTTSSVKTSPSSNIIYTITGTGINGCINITRDTVIVNPLPTPISGATFLCQNTPTHLTSSPESGIWSSSDTSVISITSSGIATGIDIGSAIITYTIGTGCKTTQNISSHPYPADIVGDTSVCPGNSILYNNSTLGGVWSLTNLTSGSINSDGIFSALSAGHDTILYTLSPGCSKAINITVNPLPEDISGPTTICKGNSELFSSITLGGTWSLSDTSIATISSSGLLNTYSEGTLNITYTLSSGCYTIKTITINPLPAGILGADSTCPLETIQLTNSTLGGSWSTTGLSTTINEIGQLHAFSSGNDTVYYTLSTGCYTKLPIRINSLPENITGSSNLCVNSSQILVNSTSGGVWSQINAEIDSLNNGFVFAKHEGIDTIIYTLPTTCKKKFVLNILPQPENIIGPDTLCPGTSIQLTNTTLGGSWLNIMPSIASLNDSGIVSGISSGNDSVYYVLSTGCKKGISIRVNPLPALITGEDSVCQNSQIVLNNTTPGGTWTTSNSRAMIDSSGTITGTSPGIDTISYVLATGCLQKKSVTVLPIPSPIIGIDSVCVNSSASMYNLTAGGVWSTNNPILTSISSSGIVYGLSSGVDSITYTLTTGCRVVKPFKINPLPIPLFSDSTSCIGSPLILRDTSGSPAYTVYPSTPGLLTITLSNASGCSSNVSSMIYPNPSPITGNTGICLGTTSILTDSIVGGVWTSADTNVASISAAGILFGRNPGSTTVTYTLATGCYTTATVNVNVLFTIGGLYSSNPTECNNNDGKIVLTGIGSNILYTVSYLKNGSYFVRSILSDSLGNIIIDSLTKGIYTNINVSLSGCTSNSLAVTLNDPSPPNNPILSSNSPVCSGSDLNLHSTTSTPGVSYTWIGPNSFISSLQNPIRTLTLIDSGWYKLTVTKLNCISTDSIYVVTDTIPQSGPIIGVETVCLYSSILFSDTATGIWRIKTGNASIDSLGNVTALFYGYDTVMHITNNHCGSDTSTIPIFINKVPEVDSISGISNICAGATFIFTETTVGGLWSTTNSNAIISASGLVTGVHSGLDTIIYSVTNICGTGTAMHPIEVIPLPDAGTITGVTTFCHGLTSLVESSIVGGSWSSSNTSIASVSSTGIVYGVNPGTANITYTYSNYCGVDYDVTNVNVLAQPFAGILNGDSSICLNETSKLYSNLEGTNWVSLNSSVISLDSISENGDSIQINGIASGTTTILHIVSNSCGIDTSYYSVTVESPATLSSTHNLSVCSENEFSYIPTMLGSNPQFYWQRDTVSQIVNSSFSGVDSIKETLSSSSNFPIEVTYRITLLDKGCQAYDSIKLNVKPKPILNSPNNVRVCSGSSVNYSAISLTPGTTFSWIRHYVNGINPDSSSGVGNLISEALDNIFSSPNSTEYIFNLNADGCTNSQSVLVTVEQHLPAIPHIVIAPLPHVCINSNYHNFGADVPPPSGMTYNWYGLGGAEVWATGLTRQFCLVNFPSNGLNWVVLACSYDGNICASKDSFQLFVGPHLSDSAAVNYSAPAFICLLNDQDTYQWGYDDRATLDSTILPFETNQAYINNNPDLSHKFYWVITTKDGCMQKNYLETPTAIIPAPLENRFSLNIFPNPNGGFFSLKVNSSYNEKVYLQIIDAVGKVIENEQLITNKQTDISFNQPPGIYLIKVQTMHGTITEKIIVQ